MAESALTGGFPNGISSGSIIGTPALSQALESNQGVELLRWKASLNEAHMLFLMTRVSFARHDSEGQDCLRALFNDLYVCFPIRFICMINIWWSKLVEIIEDLWLVSLWLGTMGSLGESTSGRWRSSQAGGSSLVRLALVPSLTLHPGMPPTLSSYSALTYLTTKQYQGNRGGRGQLCFISEASLSTYG